MSVQDDRIMFHTWKGGSIMEAFTDTVGEHLLGAIQVDIEQHLFEQWNNRNLDEGSDYAEWQFMQFAPDSLKQSYNEYYGYTEKDEYYLC